MSEAAMQTFIVSAENHNDAERNVVFLVQAESHRDAWQSARRAARTGKGALKRAPNSDELVPTRLPGDITVRRVLAAEGGRRGRPPKITATDLLHLAQRRNVSVPPRVKRVLTELEQSA